MSTILGKWFSKMASQPGEVTQLLIELRAGNRNAEEKLISLVYAELRRLAAHYLRGERPDHTLQATALVNEAYIRLTGLQDVDWHDRSHFFAIAASMMRRILVDHARAHKTAKRGEGAISITFDEAMISVHEREAEIMALDEALCLLAQIDERQSKIVELRFFAGMSEEETGQALGISARTVKRDWRIAKAWLFARLRR
jgi:RNA polymerase sigma factor (TIGR02999 family)